MSETTRIADRRDVFRSRHATAASAGALLGSAFAMRALGPAERWSLRVGETLTGDRGQIAGFDLTKPINILSVSGDSRGLTARLGPDEWLIINDAVSTGSIGSQLADELAGVAHTLVDVSHRNVAIEITGTHAADVLNTGCPLDLGDAAFPAGSATRTLFAKAEIVIMRLADADAAPVYRLECWRSFGRYVHDMLTDSAALLGADG